MTTKFNNADVDYIYEWLLVNEKFTEDELSLVTKGFGDNINTYDTICYVRYGYDFDQLFESEQSEND